MIIIQKCFNACSEIEIITLFFLRYFYFIKRIIQNCPIVFCLVGRKPKELWDGSENNGVGGIYKETS